MTLRARLKLPKEHGAWAMLYVSFALGAIVSASPSFRLLLLLFSVTFFFIGREPFLMWYRARNRGRQDYEARRLAIGYFALAGLASMPLVFFYHLYWLAAVGLATILLLAVNAYQALRHVDRTIGGEIIGIAGLTLTAPAAYYVSRGAFEATALWLWLLCVLYFASSVFYVKLRINTINPRREAARKQASWRCVAYHTFLLAALLALMLSGSLNLFALAAFSPVILRSFWQLASPVQQVNLRRLGWLEVIYSIVFLILTAQTFRTV